MSTLTHRIAAIQVKMLHIQYRMKKIFEDQQQLVEKSSNYKNHKDTVLGLFNAVYNTLDMLITFEHLNQLFDDIFKTPEIDIKSNKELRAILGKSKQAATRWIAVRNKLGGHIDIEVVEDFCKQHNYYGVFLSDNLEVDAGVLNMLMIISAVNTARDKSDIFGRDLDLKKNGPAEISLLVRELNKDWQVAFEYFLPMMQFLYQTGKKEKMLNTHPNDWKGIVIE